MDQEHFFEWAFRGSRSRYEIQSFGQCQTSKVENKCVLPSADLWQILEIPKKLNLATLLLLLLVLLTFGQANVTDAARRHYRVRPNSVEKLHNRTTKKCLAERDPIMRIMADQLCELCHGMFSHVNPNLRAQCSSQCYKNAQFRKCLEMYTALPEGHPGGTVETKRNEEKGVEGRETEQWQWAQKS